MTEEQFSKLRALFSELEEQEKEVKKIKADIESYISMEIWNYLSTGVEFK